MTLLLQSSIQITTQQLLHFYKKIVTIHVKKSQFTINPAHKKFTFLYGKFYKYNIHLHPKIYCPHCVLWSLISEAYNNCMEWLVVAGCGKSYLQWGVQWYYPEDKKMQDLAVDDLLFAVSGLHVSSLLGQSCWNYRHDHWDLEAVL